MPARSRPFADTISSADTSMTRLQDLLLGTEVLQEFLRDLTGLAAEAVGDDISCGVTVLLDGHYSTPASSDERANRLDEIQYTADLGPCLHALRTVTEVLISDVATETRWPAYARHAAELGLRSSMSLPLLVDDRATGALNLYRFGNPGFSDEEQRTARRFAAEVTRAMLLAVRQARQLRLNDDLQTAMGTRRVIDQAIGVVMAQNRCTSDEAFGLLRLASQHRNVKLRQVATDIVTSVSGEAPTVDAHFRR